jgi:16S rRNA (adenine1518-N6/adenine1519-N6)-dimethyltransferase
LPEPAPPPSDLPPLREVIARYGLDARRSLGQHFLLDLNLTRRIARAAGDLARGTTIEIGPGPGGLTRALLELGARHVIAIERDARCVEALGELVAAYPGRLEILEGDALETDAAALGEAPRRIAANLPYNISTVLLLNWLARIGAFESLTLMFQREVAERLAARPRSKDYGRLSVMTQWLCAVELCFNIAKEAFVPPPKIASTVVRLTPRPTPIAEARRKDLEAVTAAAFGQRRKMLRASLKSLGVDVAILLAAAGLTPTARAEEIPVEGFCALAREYRKLKLPDARS